VNALTEVTGMAVARTADFENGAVDAETLATEPAILFDELAVAVVDTPPESLAALSAAASEEGSILAIEPERVVYAIDEGVRLADSATTLSPDSAEVELPMPPPAALPRPAAPPQGTLPLDYLLGYRAAVNHLVDQVLSAAGLPAAAGAGIAPAAVDQTLITWGLQATGVPESRYSGKGVRVAVLDTGMDLQHPDFVGRTLVARSFITGEGVQDGHGHGTHCIGTACGPKLPGQMPRYGIAYDSEIYVGKVLSNRGSGSDSGILAGIDWAIHNSCRVVSMSLGAATVAGQGYSRIFEFVARRALSAGTLIVAAAGNESQRPGLIEPVSHPANCPSIMAVAAFDVQLQVALFSCGGINPQGGQVDIAGPGVLVRSAWPRPVLYRTISGTSMATPHVAGVAALMQQAALANLGRYLTPAEVRNVLQNTAVSNEGAASGLPNYQGYTMGAGLVDALAAVRERVPNLEAVFVGEGYLRDELRAQLREAQRRNQKLEDDLRVASVRGGRGVTVRNGRVDLITEKVEAKDLDELRAYADRYMEMIHKGVVAVTSGDNFVIKASKDAGVDVKDFTSLFGRGGGGPQLVQGKLTVPADEAFNKLEQALK
jgi:subtilisin family serine protease